MNFTENVLNEILCTDVCLKMLFYYFIEFNYLQICLTKACIFRQSYDFMKKNPFS